MTLIPINYSIACPDKWRMAWPGLAYSLHFDKSFCRCFFLSNFLKTWNLLIGWFIWTCCFALNFLSKLIKTKWKNRKKECQILRLFVTLWWLLIWRVQCALTLRNKYFLWCTSIDWILLIGCDLLRNGSMLARFHYFINLDRQRSFLIKLCIENKANISRKLN